MGTLKIAQTVGPTGRETHVVDEETGAEIGNVQEIEIRATLQGTVAKLTVIPSRFEISVHKKDVAVVTPPARFEPPPEDVTAIAAKGE